MGRIATTHMDLLENLSRAILWPIHFDFCLVNNTTSPNELARMQASRSPPGDHANFKMMSSSKCVSCRGAEPSSGIAQMLDTPSMPLLRTLVSEAASGDHRTGR